MLTFAYNFFAHNTSQQKGIGSVPIWDLSMWRWHILLAHIWVFLGHSRVQNMLHMLIDNYKLSPGVCVCVAPG